MPGLSLCCSLSPITATRRGDIDKAKTLLVHNERYNVETVWAGRHLDLSFAAYSQYPRMRLETEDSVIFLEGCVYNKSKDVLKRELETIGTQISRGNDEEIETLLRKWILESDGEYVATFIDKSAERLVLINDAMGRLPLFLYQRTEEVFIAREPKYIITAADHKLLDRVGMAEFLTYGFNMGSRTMFQDARRLEPASMLWFSPRERRIDLRVVHQWIFGSNIDHARSIDDFADELSERFLAATRNRVAALQPLQPALCLSGGLDSRAVLAAMVNLDCSFTAQTCADEVGDPADVSVAEELVKILPCKWQKLRLRSAQLEDFMTIVRLQEGGSSCVMAQAIDHFRQVFSLLGANTVLYTGDGGGNVMYGLTPIRHLASLQDAAKVLVQTLRLIRPETASRLVGLPPGQLDAAIEEALAHYPESEVDWKYAHYKIFGRPYRFIMEGEDRVRFFFWLGAPFWDIEILRLMMSVPEKMKTNYRLYSRLLRRLDARSLSVKYANIKSRIDSPWLQMHQAIKTFILSHPKLYQKVRALRDRRAYMTYSHADLDGVIRQIIERSQLLHEYMDMPYLRSLHDSGQRKIDYFLLATLVLRVDLIENDYAIRRETS